MRYVCKILMTVLLYNSCNKINRAPIKLDEFASLTIIPTTKENTGVGIIFVIFIWSVVINIYNSLTLTLYIIFYFIILYYIKMNLSTSVEFMNV